MIPKDAFALDKAIHDLVLEELRFQAAVAGAKMKGA